MSELTPTPSLRGAAASPSGGGAASSGSPVVPPTPTPSLRGAAASPSEGASALGGGPAHTEGIAVLRVKGLSAGYGPMRVLHDLDFIIHAGERVGLVGLNGHGKSTLFYAIAGLTGWQRGSILLNGVEVGRTRSQGPGRYTHEVVRQGLALIPQGDEIFHGLTVEEHLDSGAFTPRAWKERAQRKDRVLEIFPPLRKLMRTPVGRLSGGERRMVSIGRGLMAEAALFLVDEPSLGLAPKIGKGVMDALIGVDLGQSAMVIAEQNVALLEGRVDRVIGMHAGKLKGEAGASMSLQTARSI